MLHFLAENGGTIILSLLLAAIVAAILVHLVGKKKRGESSCGCNCEGCASAGLCHPKKK
jgi:hypothetical protein